MRARIGTMAWCKALATAGGACLLLGAAPPAATQEMPHFDVNFSCKHIAGFGGDYSHMMFDSCMKIEQKSYNHLKPRWGDIPAEIKKYCVNVAAFGGDPTYQMLESCVKMELKAKKADANTQFHY